MTLIRRCLVHAAVFVFSKALHTAAVPKNKRHLNTSKAKMDKVRCFLFQYLDIMSWTYKFVIFWYAVMLSPAKPLVAFSSPLASDISCELNRSGSDLQKADLVTRDSLPAGFASTEDQDIAGSSVYDMQRHVDSLCCLKGSFVESHRPVCAVLLKRGPPGVRGDSEGALTGTRPRGFEDAAGCSSPCYV